MYQYVKTYEIYENSTGVLLVDNLTFEQVAEQAQTYMDFFETTDISVVCREYINNNSIHSTTAQLFKHEYINYFEQLQTMGNLL